MFDQFIVQARIETTQQFCGLFGVDQETESELLDGPPPEVTDRSPGVELADDGAPG